MQTPSYVFYSKLVQRQTNYKKINRPKKLTLPIFNYPSDKKFLTGR